MKNFVNGYKNALLRQNAEIERQAQRRLRICATCPKAKTVAGVKVCGECGCPLAALTRQNGKVCSKWKLFIK